MLPLFPAPTGRALGRILAAALFGTALVACSAIFGIHEGVPTTGGTADGAAAPGADADVDGDVDGAPPEDACATPCDQAGTTRCAATGVQTCTAVGGCQGWLTTTSCGTDGMCCAGAGAVPACVPYDNANCFACGTQCSGGTPQCQVLAKKCGCNAAQCSPSSQGCNPVTANCEACVAPAVAATDLYVDQNVTFPTTVPLGTLPCPFTTITAALTYAKTHATVTTIHVGPGIYTTGETFPFVLRGLTLVGAGADKTTIKGQGTYDRSTFGGPITAANLKVTVVMGDQGAASGIASLTVAPATASATNDATHIGIFCDRGTIATAVPSALPTPNSTVTKVVVANGYSRGLISTTTTANAVPSGCNVVVSGSQFLGGVGNGLSVVGANYTPVAANDTMGAGLTVGQDGAAGATSVKSYRFGANDGRCIDATTQSVLSVVNATLSDCAYGVSVFNRYGGGSGTPPVNIQKSVIRDISWRGVSLQCTARILDFSDNLVSNVHYVNGDAWGVAMEDDTNSTLCAVPAVNGTSPNIAHARRNKIIGNDNGVAVSVFPSTDPPLFNVTDFGTPADPGNNVFRCNSVVVAGTGLIGRDIVVGRPRGSIVVGFAGNQWDHATSGLPTIVETGDTDAVPDGTDAAIYTATTGHAGVDLTGATLATDPCPAGHIPGPP